LPFMPLYVNDWQGSATVQLMSDAAYRCYMELLCYQWKAGKLPESISSLARLAGKHPRSFRRLWDVYLAELFDQLPDGCYQNARCAREREKALLTHTHRVNAGRAGGKAKAGLEPGSSNAKAGLKQSQSQSEPQSEPEAQETTSSTGVDWDGVACDWNEIAVKHGRPCVIGMNDDRKAKYKARLKEFPDFWEIIEREFEQLSEFAQTGTWLTFDWCLGKKNFPKLAEGNYREQAEAEDLITRKAREAKERRLEREARSA